MHFLRKARTEWNDAPTPIVPGTLSRVHELTYLIPYPTRQFFDPIQKVNSRPWLDAHAGAMICTRVAIEREAQLPECNEEETAEERLDALQAACREATWIATFTILETSANWNAFYGAVDEDDRATKLDTPMHDQFDFGSFFGEVLSNPR